MGLYLIFLFRWFAGVLLAFSALLYFLKSFRDSSCVRSSREASPAENESATSKLLSNEQTTYQSVAPATNNPHVSQTPVVVTKPPEGTVPTVTVHQQPQTHGAVARSLPGEASSDDEVAPVGYKHVYAPTARTQPSVTSPAVLPQRNNPFNNDTDGFEHSLERPASTNPFDEDSATQQPKRPPSFNPFE